MVFLTRIVLCIAERKAPRKFRRGFIDSLRLHVRGGAGGNGLPRYGGIGGKGGDIYVEAKEGDLNVDGKRVLVARGGAGGCPSTQFLGLRGQSHSIILDLKLIADIGLVGFPNAGKSTLLKAISHAQPKIASYPFTTIKPNIGVLEYPDYRQITMADLPGLIEGAHANIGLGHSFMKHVERTKLLLFVVDIEGFQLSPKHKHRSCVETVLLLNKEVELYREDLLDKPAVLAVNKMDVTGAQQRWQEIRDTLKHLKDAVNDFSEELRPSRTLEFWDIFCISAKNDPSSVLKLRCELRHILDIVAEQSKDDKELQLLHQINSKIAQKGPDVV
ncbi:GTP-binding protein 10 homolog isoform X2 [Anabrus simplex]|uniref:GTP-binding protein 10 homolog isoform X2 n=1 Tax=Anabrus simplex TaxID=316456 RepID=UPI0035A32A6C